MHNRLQNHLKNLLLPCLLLSAATGIFSALLVTAFKVLSEWVVHLCTLVYAAVRTNPAYLPLLILGAAAIGLAASLLLSVSNSCRGGGIPTSVAAIRGIVSFRWGASVLLLPVSALLTFLAGLPLGTEGPCVQMGTAVGDGVIQCVGKKKHGGWRRYMMSGGASAGFSVATVSPISAIVFSIEELHKHFSPLLLSVVSVSVMTAQITMRALSAIGIGDTVFFSIPTLPTIAPTLFFAPVCIGLVCGLCSILFTRLYHLIDHLMRRALHAIPDKIVFSVLFSLISVVGFFLSDTLGAGHSLISALLYDRGAWYLLILVFLIRAVGMMVSNTSGVTGGVFLPTLAFGAIIGSLCAQGMIALGWIGAEHYTLLVVLGIASFLGATSRIPMTASIFAMEGLGAMGNALPVVIATTVALFTVEASEVEDLTDTIIDIKLHKITKGKQPVEVEATLSAEPNSFVIGKQMRDVLWPNSCVVVSYLPTEGAREHLGISVGDRITVRYTTYDPAATIEQLVALVGEQSTDTLQRMHPLS